MTDFSERVLKLALSIPSGRVTTYGRIARAAGGSAMAAQSITSILGRAWDQGEKRIPWHRIVYADGHIWVDAEHRAKRLKLYAREKIRIDEHNHIVNFQERLFEFT